MIAARNTMSGPLSLVLLLAAGLLAFRTMANRSAAPAEPTAVASVNLEEIFLGLAYRSAADAELILLAESLDGQGDGKREKIEMLAQDLELFPPGSPQYQSASQDIAKRTYELQAYLDFAVRKLDARKARTLRTIYEDIKKTVGAIAVDQGYDFVIVDDSVVRLPTDVSEAETMRQISARRLLYTNPQVDITRDVIERMNREFAAQEGG